MSIALCKCGIDMTEHDDYGDIDHDFDAAGTKHRCERVMSSGYLCTRPAYHDEEGVRCGPLTGEKLW